MDRSRLSLASLRLYLGQLLAKAHRRKKPRTNRRLTRLRELTRVGLVTVALALISLSIFFVYSYRSYARIVDARLTRGYLTSRAGIYAAPRTLRAGQKFSRDDLATVLVRSGYVAGEDASDVWNGSFSFARDSLEIRPHTPSGFPAVVRVSFDNGRIAGLSGDEVTLESFTLAPESLTYDPLIKSGTRNQLSFKDIPTVLVQAITSIEDRRFFDHHGLDVFGVGRALLRNVGDERIGQGGSTITQQLVKNTYLTPERTFRRKYAEAMLAFTLERRLSKEDIFALYCNEIYLGQRGVMAVRGVPQAARVFFGKDLKDLSLNEVATIAGMIQSPSRYSPVRHNEAARARRNIVLGTMVRDGSISLEQARAVAKEPLTIAQFDPARESVAPYFIDYVSRLDDSGAGIQSMDNPQVTVTTLDLDLQRMATEAIAKQLERLDAIYQPRGLTPQAALVALDPRTGNVLAMVGGRDYAQSQLNRATDARRQPGSVFKPFVYAAALESGLSPLRLFKDAPQEFTYDRKFKYRPENYGGGFSMRDVPMRTGLIKSLNVVTVDVAMQTGLARVANTAERFGLPRPTPYPALALGTTEVTPLQIAAAYAVFANGGNAITPNVMAQSKPAEPEQIIQPTTAFMITDMLEGVIDHGTARAARGSVKGAALAGKTGTSRDGWFVGYSPNLVCAVWIGFDDNKQLGLTGAEAALPVWTEFMKNAVDQRPELGEKAFVQPDGITIAEIDPETEGLATGKCPSHERVALLSTEAPTSECFRHNIYFDLRNDASETIPTMTRAEVPLPSLRPRRRRDDVAQLRNTQTETDRSGRKILVNEMRVRP
jgi:penicillin-binding protein 1B